MNAAQREAHVVDSLVWPRYALGELCRIELGSTPARSDARNWDSPRSTQNVWLSIADMPTDLHALALDSREYVSDAATGRMRLVPKGTLLVSFKLTLGRLCYAGRDLYTNEAIAALHDLDPARICSEYLYWYLTYFDWQAAAEGEDKVKGKTLNKAKLELLPVLVPPLDEQKRIVAVLDQAFAALDRARAHAEANLADAGELFKVKLDATFKSAGKNKIRVDELFRVGSSKRVLKSEWKDSGVPFYRGREITRLALDGRVANELFISEGHYAELAAKTGVPEPGDIVITAIGTIGNAYVVGKDDRFYFKDASVLWMHRTSEVSSDFVKFWIRSSLFHDQLERGNGATVDTLTIGKLQGLLMPELSAKEQERVVEELTALEKGIGCLNSSYERKLADLATLRQSLLQKAFSGQLS